MVTQAAVSVRRARLTRCKLFTVYSGSDVRRALVSSFRERRKERERRCLVGLHAMQLTPLPLPLSQQSPHQPRTSRLRRQRAAGSSSAAELRPPLQLLPLLPTTAVDNCTGLARWLAAQWIRPVT